MSDTITVIQCLLV